MGYTPTPNTRHPPPSALRPEPGRRTIVGSQEHGHIHPEQRVDDYAHLLRPDRPGHSHRRRRITAPGQRLSGDDGLAHIPEVHHIEACLAQDPGRCPCQTTPSRTVQDLDQDVLTLGNRRRGSRLPAVGAAGERRRPCREGERQPRYSATGGTARLFQNRKVGSGIIQPNSIEYASRRRATS